MFQHAARRLTTGMAPIEKSPRKWVPRRLRVHVGMACSILVENTLPSCSRKPCAQADLRHRSCSCEGSIVESDFALHT